MDKLKLYRQAIKAVLKDYANLSPSKDELLTQLIFDDEGGHYQLMYVGWDRGTRVYGVIIHIDLINGKAWLQYNGTEFDIAKELMAQGVEREDIVLGFYPKSTRKYTDYAIT
ncbi:MAG: XisI protein [Thiofilum sp.]|uniref:XisI protein n=1 Tax=Thiofilum sp. TaxID=2212733 RepID=UPI0025CE6F99|nr:XisI protein [Thiofilum sp.]MBK8451802.1 XisI protein [Thiofilum sp.]